MRRVGLALATALLLTACVSAGEQRATPTTKGVPPEGYRRALAAATRTVEVALGSVAAATTYESLRARLDRASKASATAAARLNRVPVPAEVRTEHAALVTALRQLKGDLADLELHVHWQELCTASVVLPRAAKLAGFVAVRDAGRALAAKGGTNGYKAELRLPATPVVTGRRLATGQFVRPGSRTGRGVLKIFNAPDQDAVVALALGKRSAISVYVRKGSNYTVRGIRDGTYKIYMTTGQDWDARARGFARNCGFERYDEPFKFWTSTTATRISWSVWTIDLGSGRPGNKPNTPSSDLLPSDFPT